MTRPAPFFYPEFPAHELLKSRGAPRSSRWPAVRAAHLAKHPTCRACGARDDLEVHHKRPFHSHPELELDPTNLITLCEKPGHWCHFREGHGYDWSRFNDRVETDADDALARVRRVHA